MKYQKYNELIEQLNQLPQFNTYISIAKEIQRLHPEEEISLNHFKRYISELLNTKMEVTKRVYNKAGEVIKTVESKRLAAIEAIPPGFEPRKIVNLGHGVQNITYEAKKKEEEGLLLETIERLLKRLKTPLKYTPPVIPKTNDLILCLYTSDKHVGSEQNEIDLYKNAQGHTAKMYDIYCEVLKLQRRFGAFSKMYYFDLGDALDGFNNKTTRGGHELEQNLNNRNQFDFLVETEIKFINSIIEAGVAQDYKFIATTNDNHSGDFSYFAWRLIFEYIQKTYNLPTVLNTEFLGFEQIGTHDIIFTHGKDTQYRRNGLPLNLDNKTELFIKEYCLEHNLKNPRVIKGDLHQFSMNRGKWFDYINVASLVGNTTYTTTNFGKNKAGFYYEIFNPAEEGYIASFKSLD